MKRELPAYLSPMAVAVDKDSSQDTVIRAIYDNDLDAIKVVGPEGTTVAIGILPADAEAWVPRLEKKKAATKKITKKKKGLK